MKPAPFAFAPPGRPLARYRLSRAEAEAAYGPAQYRPGGPRSLPAWGLELDCGLVVEIQIDESGGFALLHTEPRELPHALWHLALGDRLEWRADHDDEGWTRALEEYHPLSWGRWAVVDRAAQSREPCLSPAEARCRLAARPAGGGPAHIEETPLSEARARRQRSIDPATVKRRTRGAAHPRYEVWVVHTDGAESLVELAPDAEDAQRRRTRIAERVDGRVEVRVRSAG